MGAAHDQLVALVPLQRCWKLLDAGEARGETTRPPSLSKTGLANAKMQSQPELEHIGQSPRAAAKSSQMSTSDWGDGLLITKYETLRRVEQTTPGHRASHSGRDAVLQTSRCPFFAAAVCPPEPLRTAPRRGTDISVRGPVVFSNTSPILPPWKA